MMIREIMIILHALCDITIALWRDNARVFAKKSFFKFCTSANPAGFFR